MKNVLRALRSEQKLTQQQLGDLVHVSRQAINALETGKHLPSLDLAYRIASIFRLAVEEVFDNPHKDQSE